MTLESLALQGNANVYENLAATVASRIREARKACFRECFQISAIPNTGWNLYSNIHGIEFINIPCRSV